MAKAVPVTRVRFPAESAQVMQAEIDEANAAKAADEAAYTAEVVPTLPAPPTADALAADPEAKYAFIAQYKDAGNGLFKQGKYQWAIRVYTSGVEALLSAAYASRERMLWDYFARVPCGQCYSNAALCALKANEHKQAAMLCARAMECKPEDTDLVKVLLRQGQALLGLGRAQEAKDSLERALEKDPANRAVRQSARDGHAPTRAHPTPASHPSPPIGTPLRHAPSARRCARRWPRRGRRSRSWPRRRTRGSSRRSTSRSAG